MLCNIAMMIEKLSIEGQKSNEIKSYSKF